MAEKSCLSLLPVRHYIQTLSTGIYCFQKGKTLSFWYYEITTMYFLPKRGRIHRAPTLSCKVSCEFWKHVLSWLRDNDINVGELKEADLIFGTE